METSDANSQGKVSLNASRPRKFILGDDLQLEQALDGGASSLGLLFGKGK